jgi:hypothetical protein
MINLEILGKLNCDGLLKLTVIILIETVNFGSNPNELSTSVCGQFTSGGKIIVLFVWLVEWISHPDLVPLEKTKTSDSACRETNRD